MLMKDFLSQYVLCKVKRKEDALHILPEWKMSCLFLNQSLSQKKEKGFNFLGTCYFPQLLLYWTKENQADASRSTERTKYHSRGLHSRGLDLFLNFWSRKQDVLVQKCTAADTVSISLMSMHSLWEKGALKISQSYKNLSVEGNSVSVAQWTRPNLKLFQLLLLFRLKDQARKFLANKEKQEHCMFIWPYKRAVDHSSLLQFNTAPRTTKVSHY